MRPVLAVDDELLKRELPRLFCAASGLMGPNHDDPG